MFFGSTTTGDAYGYNPTQRQHLEFKNIWENRYQSADYQGNMESR